MTSRQRDVYNVSRLTAELAQLVKAGLPALWLQGEISNFAAPRSGHWYFSLKDANSQIRCAMFANRNRQLRFQPRDGEQVLVRAKAGVFEPRGELQLIVEQLQPAGEGALTTQFEALKARLQAEGLFAVEHKKPLPTFPRRLGVITSPTGAAVQDVLHVLQRRFPYLDVIIYPTLVQGDVGEDIAGLLRHVQARNEVDVVLLTRGGGSLEDLWAFNHEALARAIHACSLPVVSAVGHEVDFTIADFVADVRAPTPSAAAEVISPDTQAVLQQLQRFEQRLLSTVQQGITQRQTQVQQFARVLRGVPERLTQRRHQQADLLEIRLRNAYARRMSAAREALQELNTRLYEMDPRHTLGQAQRRQQVLAMRLQQVAAGSVRQRQQRLQHLQQRLWQHNMQHQVAVLAGRQQALAGRLHHVMQQRLNQSQQQLVRLGKQLNGISPLAVLERGYTIATQQDGRVLRSVDDSEVDTSLTLLLVDGELDCTVTNIRPQTTQKDEQ